MPALASANTAEVIQHPRDQLPGGDGSARIGRRVGHVSGGCPLLWSDGQWLRRLVDWNRDLYAVGPVGTPRRKVRTLVERDHIRHWRLIHPQVKLLVGE